MKSEEKAQAETDNTEAEKALASLELELEALANADEQWFTIRLSELTKEVELKHLHSKTKKPKGRGLG